MNSLEQAALSGALTTISLDSPDPDGREPERNNHSDDGELDETDGVLELQDDYDFDHPSSVAALMSRGWSGNTGPKGVLLDFKASHGKSGAILGGSDDRGGPALNTRRMHHKQSSSNSETDSESDKDTRHPPTTSSLYTSGRRTHRIIDRRPAGFSMMNSRGRSGSSPPSASPINSGSKSFKTDSRGKKLFGHLREVGVDNFIQAVEAERDDKETVVLVHLYDPALDACMILNSHLSSLARLYPRTKFLRALASELDFFNHSSSSSHSDDFTFPTLSVTPRASSETNNGPLIDVDGTHESEERRARRPTDSDILPTLLWYRGGEYVQSLPAMERELPSGTIKKGEAGCAELQTLLSRFGILK